MTDKGQVTQADREWESGFNAGLDWTANFINSLDTEDMSAKDVRSAIYRACIEKRPSHRIASTAKLEAERDALLREGVGYAKHYREVVEKVADAVAEYQQEAKKCWHGDELIASPELTHAVNNLAGAVNQVVSSTKPNTLFEQWEYRIDTLLANQTPTPSKESE